MSENERPLSANPLSHEEWLALLSDGEIEIVGRMPWSSNATFLVQVAAGDVVKRAIYKPLAGEYPLWDFPDGLYRREVAAYELSDALELGIVPETVMRTDAPYDEGSLQRFIDADFEQHYFTLFDESRFHDRLRMIAGFDLLLNSADRKGGHLLIDGDGQIYGIDNGLSFHPQNKLRTVMWDFAGEPVPTRIVACAKSLVTKLPAELSELLNDAERRALIARAKRVVGCPIFPTPDFDGRPYPWPRI